MERTTAGPRPADVGDAPVGGGRFRPPLPVLAIVAFSVALLVLTMPTVRRAIADPAGRAPVHGVTEVRAVDDLWESFAFRPAVVSVPVGTTVTWTSDSRAPHPIAFADGAASGTMLDGDRWRRTFREPGTYAYVCTIHRGMDGRVVVTPMP